MVWWHHHYLEKDKLTDIYRWLVFHRLCSKTLDYLDDLELAKSLSQVAILLTWISKQMMFDEILYDIILKYMKRRSWTLARLLVLAVSEEETWTEFYWSEVYGSSVAKNSRQCVIHKASWDWRADVFEQKKAIQEDKKFSEMRWGSGQGSVVLVKLKKKT